MKIFVSFAKSVIALCVQGRTWNSGLGKGSLREDEDGAKNLTWCETHME